MQDNQENSTEAIQRSIEKKIQDWLPRPGDKLFLDSQNAKHLDPLGYSSPGERSPIGRWELYADGFRNAADRIVDSCEGHPWEDDLIYPVLALYRHHIELQLKIVIKSASKGEEIKDWLYRTHDMERLWAKLNEVYPECHKWADPDWTTACSALLDEFSKHDPRSIAARYPIDKEKQTLETLERVDLQVLKTGIHKISHYLETIIESIHQDLEWSAEMASW